MKLFVSNISLYKCFIVQTIKVSEFFFIQFITLK